MLVKDRQVSIEVKVACGNRQCQTTVKGLATPKHTSGCNGAPGYLEFYIDPTPYGWSESGFCKKCK